MSCAAAVPMVWLTIREASAYYGAHDGAIRMRIRRGMLSSIRGESGNVLVASIPVRAPINTADKLAMAVANNKAAAHSRAMKILPVIRDIQASGVTSIFGIANELNNRGILIARGGRWHDSTVRSMLARAPC